MLVQTWGQIITDSFTTLWTGFINFLPNLLGAIIVFLIGWVIAVALGKITNQIIRALRVDQILEKMGLGKPLERAGLSLDSGKFVGGLVKWFLIIVFLMAATDILHLKGVTDFLQQVVFYIPHIIVAALIMLIGVMVANFLQKVVIASVEAAKLKSANFLGALTKWSILIFALLTALAQLGIARMLIESLVMGIIAALAIAFGLAFGLGGKEYASQALAKLKEEISEEK